MKRPRLFRHLGAVGHARHAAACVHRQTWGARRPQREQRCCSARPAARRSWAWRTRRRLAETARPWQQTLGEADGGENAASQTAACCLVAAAAAAASAVASPPRRSQACAHGMRRAGLGRHRPQQPFWRLRAANQTGTAARAAVSSWHSSATVAASRGSAETSSTSSARRSMGAGARAPSAPPPPDRSMPPHRPSGSAASARGDVATYSLAGNRPWEVRTERALNSLPSPFPLLDVR